MNGMHEDMNGSAVALGILLAASEEKLPIYIDCWLAIAQNHIGLMAYKQNDVVTATNGTTIEIVHTDAEGRMLLADTLTLASRLKPFLTIRRLCHAHRQVSGRPFSMLLAKKALDDCYMNEVSAPNALLAVAPFTKLLLSS